MAGFLLHVADQEASITKNTTTTAAQEALLDATMVTGSLRRGALVLEAARPVTEAPRPTSHICMTAMVPAPAMAVTRAEDWPPAGYLQ
jgi:hypothetical protein